MKMMEVLAGQVMGAPVLMQYTVNVNDSIYFECSHYVAEEVPKKKGREQLGASFIFLRCLSDCLLKT